MKMLSALLPVSLCLATMAAADMGSIPYKKEARIYEPSQKALIAWNGEEQILYLQTELSASTRTRMLEVIPLPSKPTVEKADPGIFKRASSLLPAKPKRHAAGDPFGAAGDNPAGRVVEVKQLGVHEIHIIEALRNGEFIRWVEKHLEAAGAETKTIPDALAKVMGEYLEEGYKWFVFDIIDVERTNTKKQPLKFRFKTDKLFYPMRITRTERGETEAEFFILTNILFNQEDCLGITRDDIKVPHKPIKIPAEKLTWLDPEITKLLGNPDDAWLRNWVIKGHLQAFTQDLLIQNPATAGKAP